jgi:hypothetical protein
MRNLMDNMWGATTGSNLYCVWVLEHDDEGDRLVPIWIDPALTAFKSCAGETSDRIDRAATPFTGHEGEGVNQFAAEHLTSILPRRS